MSYWDCHCSVTGHCLTINNISDWGRGRGPVNTSQAVNIYPLVRLCTSNGPGACPGMFTARCSGEGSLQPLTIICSLSDTLLVMDKLQQN